MRSAFTPVSHNFLQFRPVCFICYIVTLIYWLMRLYVALLSQHPRMWSYTLYSGTLACSAYAVMLPACLQAVLLVRVEALTSLMQQAVAQSQLQPYLPLPSLAVTFATTQVQVHTCTPRHSSAAYFSVCLFGLQCTLQSEVLGHMTAALGSSTTCSNRAPGGSQDKAWRSHPQ